jgi:hypothetical protein
MLQYRRRFHAILCRWDRSRHRCKFSPLASWEQLTSQLRSVLACILPIFAPDMFSTLGWGWGCTLLALVALVAVPAPVVVS